MTINPLGALLPAAGSANAAGILPCAASGIGGAVPGGGGTSLGNLTSEPTSGLGDDASSMNMLSQLAATLGNLASNCTASASAGASAAAGAVGAASSGISVPAPSSSGQQFRSYGSLQQAQQGGSNGDAMLASLISGGPSSDADDA